VAIYAAQMNMTVRYGDVAEGKRWVSVPQYLDLYKAEMCSHRRYEEHLML